jgi:plasmid rolling circle replication initiator protein Rep
MSTEGTSSFYLTEASASDVKFDIHKSISDEIARLYGLQTEDGFTGFLSGSKFISFGKHSLRINSCGSWLRFVKVDGKIKLVDARFCKCPTCSMCQWRRSLKWRAKFLTLLPEIQKNYPSHKWVFLTLTIRNCGLDDLRPTLTHLNGAFNRLSKLKQFPMDGLVKSVEVTRAWDCYYKGKFIGRHGTTWISRWEYQHKQVLELKPTDEVHPHLHVCGLVPASYFSHGYLNHEQWTQMWRRSLRVDYDPIVNIKTVKPTKKQLLPTPEEFAENPELADKSGMVQAICETLKYTVKEQDLIGSYCQDDNANSSWLKAITQHLYKTRKVEYRGVLKEIGKELDQAINDDNLVNINDDVEPEGKPIEELEFRWNSAIKRYIFSHSIDLTKTLLSESVY